MLDIVRKVREHVIVPLMGRLGTATAATIAPLLGVPNWHVQLGVGITQILLVTVDLAIDYAHRRLVANKALAQGAEVGILAAGLAANPTVRGREFQS